MKFEIKSGEAETQSGTTAGGKAYSLRKQSALMHRGDERIKVELTLGRSDQPYSPGFYELSPDSFGVGDFGELVLKRVRLQRAAALGESAKPKAAA